MNLPDLTIAKINQGLVKKEFSALELAKAYLAKIAKEDKKISSFLSVTEELALKEAKEVDKKIAEGEKVGLLSGVPCAVKDAILVEGQKCTAGSRILENYVAPYDATCVEKLKDQGAVILGKMLNMAR